MIKKPTKRQLIERVTELAADWYQAQAAARELRQLLNREYQQYFRVNGEPVPNQRRIDPENPAYDGVINFTNQTYEALTKAKRDKHGAKRRLETALRAFVDLTGTSAAPRPPLVVRRATINGETLQ
jgi:PAS domain-containing protein